MFEREKEFERGLRPLSLLLPSPAKNIFEGLTMSLAGEGIQGVRFAQTTKTNQTFVFAPRVLYLSQS
jgi:hypothetical protein